MERNALTDCDVFTVEVKSPDCSTQMSFAWPNQGVSDSYRLRRFHMGDRLHDFCDVHFIEVMTQVAVVGVDLETSVSDAPTKCNIVPLFDGAIR